MDPSTASLDGSEKTEREPSSMARGSGSATEGRSHSDPDARGDSPWTPLSRRVCVVWVASRSALWATLIAGFAVGRGVGWFTGEPWASFVAAPSPLWALPPVHVGFALLEYRAWGYCLRPHDLLVRSGWLTREVVSIPLARIQQVDSSSGPLERALDLTTLVLHTAGTRAARTRIPGIPRRRAEALRDALGREAHERAD